MCAVGGRSDDSHTLGLSLVVTVGLGCLGASRVELLSPRGGGDGFSLRSFGDTLAAGVTTQGHGIRKPSHPHPVVQFLSESRAPSS